MKRLVSWLIALQVLGLAAAPVCAQDVYAQDDVTRVTFDGRASLREIAARHLGDPDLWPEILRETGLSSVTELRRGTELRVPTGRVTRARVALEASLEAIQEATAEGARLFAPQEIGAAIDQHNDAIEARNEGDWPGCVERARRAAESAARARETSLANRDASVEAILSDRRGAVEERLPADLLWDDAPLYTLLVEEHKVRTLSASTGEITFRDDSRLRLSENSQAVIEAMSMDLLSRKQEATVSLVEGDVYALLGGSKERDTFDLAVPGVEMDAESRRFWVGRDADAARFANYDDQGELRVAAQGERVSLGRDEGTLVARGAAPTAPRRLLPPPVPTSPIDDEVVYGDRVELRWGAVAGAVAYRVEIAADPAFRRVVFHTARYRGTELESPPLERDTYSWRVFAVDDLGFQSDHAPAARFRIQDDREAPYLLVAEPDDGDVVRSTPIRVRGRAEPRVGLTLGERPAAVAPDGAFEGVVELREGANRIAAEATDDAGHVSRRVRTIVYMPDRPVRIEFDPSLPRLDDRHFLTRKPSLTVAGETDAPESRVTVRSASGRSLAGARTDSSGRFAFTVPVTGPDEELVVAVTRPSGYTSDHRIAVSVDDRPPTITLDEIPSTVTREDSLAIRGSVDDARWLRIDGEAAELADGRFAARVALRPGANRIELRAGDAAGNVSVVGFDVLLDREPPDLLGHRVRAVSSPTGNAVAIEVEVRDASAVRRTASFELQVGETIRRGYLRLDPTSGRYLGSVPLEIDAAAAATTARLVAVDLEDYLGNRQSYRFR